MIWNKNTTRCWAIKPTAKEIVMSNKKEDLIGKVVDEYMNNILDNPEVVRMALECYFKQFTTTVLVEILAGFGEDIGDA